MAIRINAECGSCGERISVPAYVVTLLVFPGDLTKNEFRFFCPSCGNAEGAPADLAMCRSLFHSAANTITLPRKHPAADKRPDLGPMTEDDVLDFMLELNRDGPLEC